MTGLIRQWDKEKYCYPAAFDRAISYLRSNDLAAFDEGKHPIEGSLIYAMIQKPVTAPAAERRYELHRDYIDIQVLLKGSREEHRYGLACPESRPTEDFLESKDLAFYPAPADARSLIVTPWQYVVYLPWELHCPACSVEAPESIVKVILKIHRSCMGG